MLETKLTGVVGDLVNPFEPVLQALENHFSDGLA